MMNKKPIFQYIRIFLPSASALTLNITALLVFLSISGCTSTNQYSSIDEFDTKKIPQNKMTAQKGGGYYLDDGPDDNPPGGLHLIPDAVPKLEPLRKANMRPYKVMGQSFEPMTTLQPYKERGTATWYGRRYHGNHTASGEVYDMYAMTAAHPTLPIPSYARVTNISNGSSVIVRINDRGPFLSNRLIDLSYTAAYKLDIIANGSSEVEVETIMPEEITAMQAAASIPPRQVSPASKLPNSSTSYLQLAAFDAEYNAHNYLSHIRTKFPVLSRAMTIRKKNGLFKIHAGPYSNQILARQAADIISQRLSIEPIIVID